MFMSKIQNDVYELGHDYFTKYVPYGRSLKKVD